MSGYSEKTQTPARLASLAQEYKDFATALEFASETMKTLEIEELTIPRANAEEVGLKQSRNFAHTVRDFLSSLRHEIAGGTDKSTAARNVLSEFKNEKRKTREKKVSKSRRKPKSDTAA